MGLAQPVLGLIARRPGLSMPTLPSGAGAGAGLEELQPGEELQKVVGYSRHRESGDTAARRGQ